MPGGASPRAARTTRVRKRRSTRARIGLALAGGGPLGGIYEVGALLALAESLQGVDLNNLAEDPYQKNNLAAANPDKVAAMQARLNSLGKESAKPLALVYVAGVGLKHGKPLMASEGGHGPALVEGDGHAITEEGFGEPEAQAAHR